MSKPSPFDFRKRLLAKEPLIGTFMKVPTSHNTEYLGQLGYDYVMLDEEHAPWDRGTLDHGLLAAKAYGTAGLVRIARSDATNILSVLDDGAIGIMCPHVNSAEKARNIVSYAHYKGGVRGAGVSRGGDHGARGPNHMAFADETTTIIAMIEDREAIDVIDEIVNVPGIDCIFIGRGDLGVSLSNGGAGMPSVKDATEKVAAACRKANKPISAVTQNMQSDEAKWLMDIGVTAMMVASDFGFLTQAAGNALKQFREAYKIAK
jgi:2-keto-3-deoxy-L-rhamnonate aldolase RhmA